MSTQRAVDRGLDRARRETPLEPLELALPHRWIVFSDHHKGARNDADDFRPCEAAYHAALAHYHAAGSILVVLGDGEELWEETPAAVIRAYHETFRLEARFHPERYRRVWGNHDDDWMERAAVRRHLDPFFPGLAVTEGLRLAVTRAGRPLGELFLSHGHQGTWESDRHRRVTRWVARTMWRPFQRLTGAGRTTPASDACLRARHDEQMYAWASRRPGLVLIAGHTHRPVWSSRTHLQKGQAELAAWRALADHERPADWADRLTTLADAVRDRAALFPPCDDSLKTVPCYFNTGCCRFADGDITGLELQDGALRLVKWGRAHGDGGPIRRAVLEEARLDDVLAAVRPPTLPPPDRGANVSGAAAPFQPPRTS